MNDRLAILVIGFLLGCYTPVFAKPTSVIVSSQRNAEVVEVVQKQGRTLIDIHSRRGIGTAILTRNACEWPDDLRLRLHLKGLESLKLTAGQQELRIEVISHLTQKADILVEDKQGKSIPLNHALQPVVFYKQPPSAKGAGYFEVVIPAGLLKSGDESLTVSWIDFYR